MVLDNLVEIGENIVLGFDVKHVVKRIRDNILGSGHGKEFTRTLMYGCTDIVWQHWRHAYYWDSTSNPEMKRVHHKLTPEHIEPKMDQR